MKYSRMVCWTTPESKKKILEISEDLPITFTDNYNVFRNNIFNDAYLMIDLTIAHKNLDNLRKLFEDFPKIEFRIISNTEYALGEVCDMFTDFGRYYFQYAPSLEKLIENFKKEYNNC